jgi:hypothetical protein
MEVYNGVKKNKSAKIPVKLIAAIVIILLVLGCIMVYSWRSLSACNYFMVKDIIARDGSVEGLSYLRGKNIFSVDLKYEAARILQSCPEYNRVRLIRLLPDRLFVDFLKRKPLALVRLYRYFAVDWDGVLFSGPSSPEESELPVILGLETKIFGPKLGKRYDIKELSLALNIIREIKANRVLKNLKINKIEVSSINNTSIYMPFASSKNSVKEFGSLEVRLGAGDIKDKINILSELIIASKSDVTSIKYIDLRFKEPVIKLRNDD